MTNRQTIQDLAKQLDQLRIATENIELTLNRLEEEEEILEARDRGPPTDPETRDRENRIIHYGNTVVILTRGLYNLTTGTVYRVSASVNRVTARDHQGRSISRIPRNTRLLLP